MLKEFHELTTAKDSRLKQLYRTIRKLGNSDITLLKDVTGFKHATCVRMLDELLANNLIDDSEVGASSGGRKPKMYRINAKKNLLIGVEISQLYTTIVLVDLNLEIQSVKKLKMPKQSGPMLVLDFISDRIAEMLGETDNTRADVLGIGIGVLARIDKKTNSIVDDAFFIGQGWQGFDIVNYLERSNQLKVLIESATNLAALAEYRKNYWNTVDSLLFVSSDFMIRSAVIFNGQLLYNRSEMVESLGHMIVDIDGKLCSCGSYGCLQTYSTLPVIYQQVIKKIKMGGSSLITDEVETIDELTYHHILQGIENHDPLCLEVLKDAAFYFGIGLSNLILQLQPQEVILGGTLGPRMFEWVKETVENRWQQLGIDDSHLQKASGSFNTVSQGAGCMVFDYFVEEDIFL